MNDESRIDPPLQDPGYQNVRRFLLYGLSLPERALRSGVGIVGGAVRESTELLVPQAFQNSKTYSVMIRQMLDYLVEDVGGVARDEESSEEQKIENFVARKAVGNFVELASLATLHLSPIMLMAIVSDIAYGSQAYLRELTEELKREGIVDENSTIDHVDDLLKAIATASATTATAFDTPPMSVDGLKETVQQTRDALRDVDATRVIPQAELQRLWDDMRDIATQENVGLLQVSGAMTLHTLSRMQNVGRGALSTIRVAGGLLDRHVIDHYRSALVDIRDKGMYRALAEVSGPYIEAVWTNFSSDKTTLTGDILSGKLVGQAWNAARRWLGRGPA